jgi:N-acetylneuraminic acid mutarotase
MPESESDPIEEAETLPPRTYLLESNPPLPLLPWQQLYLGLAALLSLVIALMPLSSETNRTALPPELPILSRITPTAVPAAQSAAGNSRWISHPSLPSGRAGLALVGVEQRLIAIGGFKDDNNSTTRLVEIYDLGTRRWSEGASKPTAAANVMGAVIDQKIYVAGGCTDQGQALTILEIYDPQQDNWTMAAPLPQARCAYGMAAVADKIYLFGGWNGEDFEDTVFVYDAIRDRWALLETTLPRSAGNMGVAVLNGWIYLVGGYDGQQEYDATYALNPDTGQWQVKASLNEARGGLGLVSNGRYLYAVGGGWNHPLSSSEKYDPQTNSWTTFETPYTGEWRNMGLTTVDNTIYAAGGLDGSKDRYLDGLVSYQLAFQVFLPISVQ